MAKNKFQDLLVILYLALCVNGQTVPNPCMFSSLPPPRPPPPSTMIASTEGVTDTTDVSRAYMTTATFNPATQSFPCIMPVSGQPPNGPIGTNSGSGNPNDAQMLMNVYNSIDPELPAVFRIFPGVTADQISALASNKTVLIQTLATIPSAMWGSMCQAGNAYLFYLEKLIQQNVRDVTYDIVKPLLVCKENCDFRIFLKYNFTQNASEFARDVKQRLRPEAARDCQKTLSSFLPNYNNMVFTGNSLLSAAGNGSLSSVANMNQLRALPPNDVLSVLSGVSGSSLDDTARRGLGAAIPPNTTFSINQLSFIIGNVPTDIIKKANASDLVANMANFSQSTMDPQLKGIMTSKVLQSNNPTLMASYIQSASPDLLRTIPLRALQQSNVPIPIANQPPAMLQLTTDSLIRSTGLQNIANTSVLQAIVTNIKPSDLTSLSSSDKINTVVRLVDAAGNGSVQLSTTQRRSFLSTFVGAMSSVSGVSATNVYSNFTSSQMTTLAPLLVDITSSSCATLSTSTSFTSFMTALSNIPSSQCSWYLPAARKNIAICSINYLTKNRTFRASDLDTLGPCFASAIPFSYLASLNASDFVAKISYFQGIQFQPNSTEGETVSKLLTTYSNTLTSSSLSTFLLSLKDLLIYSTKLNDISCSDLTTYGSTIISSVFNNRDPSNSTVSQNRLGITDNTYLNSQLSSFLTRFASCQLTTARRRRAASSSLTCTAITSSGVTSHPTDIYSAAVIATISASDFKTCISYFGDSTNNYNSAQLAALATLVQTAYNSDLSKISDTDIGSINVALLGFSATSLSTIKFTSYGTIKTLGTITKWSSDQLTSLASAVKSTMGSLTSDLVSNMGNLICGLSQSDISGLSSTTFGNVQSALTQMTSSACPSINYIYDQAKANSLLSVSISSLKEWSYVSGGISTSDLSSLSGETISQLPSAAFIAIPAATVNSLSVAQLSSLTSTQVSNLMNSVYYSQFSSTVTDALKSLSSNTDVVVSIKSGSASLYSFNLLVSSICAFLALKLISF